MIVQASGRHSGLKLGAAVTVRFDERPGAGGLVSIPRDALPGAGVLQGVETNVFVATADRAELRAVEVQSVAGDRVTVRGRLAAGELVLLGDGGLAAGDLVAVREERQ